MSTSPDFLEKEIQKILRILEKQCDDFGVSCSPPSKEENGEATREEKKSNGVVKQDA